MQSLKYKKFHIDWVLVNELAISKAPKNIYDIEIIKKNGIVSILSLCSISEAQPPEGLDIMFKTRRIILPDHKYNRDMTLLEINNALDLLSELREYGPVLVHCLAAVERSPIVCMGWLIRNNNLSLQEALDYLMQVHPGTSPLPNQLDLLLKMEKS